MRLPPALPLLVLGVLAGCASQPAPLPDGAGPTGGETRKPAPRPASKKPSVTLKKGGGYYKDDGPAEDVPDNLDDIPDAQPKWEPLHRPATKPYVVLGKEYIPNTSVAPYKARGIASWYGRKFHGQKTSIGEPYDMFAMTAAHTTLALPSYVRVTSVQSGKSVIVRVIDRGPFHPDRIIDLSYTAAYKLGLIEGGSGLVDVEAVMPGETPTVLAEAGPSVRPSKAEEDDIARLQKRLAAEEAPVQIQPPSPAVKGGIYLQLGAFGNADNAQTLKGRISRELDWKEDRLRIETSGGIHRLQVGPYANRAEADKIAEQVRQIFGFRPTVVIPRPQ